MSANAAAGASAKAKEPMSATRVISISHSGNYAGHRGPARRDERVHASQPSRSWQRSNVAICHTPAGTIRRSGDKKAAAAPLGLHSDHGATRVPVAVAARLCDLGG